jgi:hypothetical protein
MLAVPFSSLIPIVFLCPLTSTQRVERKPVHGMAQMLVTGESKLYYTTFATGLSYRDRSRLSLKLPEGIPTVLSIAELGPNRRYCGSGFTAGQRLGHFSCRHSGEKTLNILVVAVNRLDRGLQLDNQRQQKFRFGSNHVFGDRELRLVELVPKLLRACFTEVVLARGEAVPAPARKLGEGLRGGIHFEKIQRDLGFQVLKDLQRTRIILFKCILI